MEARQNGPKVNINNNLMPVKHRKINILTNGAKSILSYKFHIYYDIIKSCLIVRMHNLKKIYKSELPLKLKLYIWYTLTATWDELDGLRIYINNKLLDHNIGIKNELIDIEQTSKEGNFLM